VGLFFWPDRGTPMYAVAPHSFLPERGKTTEKLSINSNSYQHTFTKEWMCTLDSILPVWSLYPVHHTGMPDSQGEIASIKFLKIVRNDNRYYFSGV
jgi:hypothetical protein